MVWRGNINIELYRS